MTTPQNNVDRLNRNQSAVRLPVTTNLTVNSGDLVYWDGTNYTVTPLSAYSQVASNFLGIALQSNANLIYPGDADQVGVLVLVRGAVWLNSTVGDTYSPFDDVTVGADAQTVAKASVSSSNRVGFVIVDPPSSPRPNQATPAPETVTGGSRVRVCLEPKHKYAAAV